MAWFFHLPTGRPGHSCLSPWLLPQHHFCEAPSLFAVRSFSDWQHYSSYRISNWENQRPHWPFWTWPGWTTGPPSTHLSILFRSRTCQSGCKAILKKVWCDIEGPGGKRSSFPLLICTALITVSTIFKPVGSDGRMDYRISQKAPGWHRSRGSDSDHEALCEVLNKEQGCGAAGLTLAFHTSRDR